MFQAQPTPGPVRHRLDRGDGRVAGPVRWPSRLAPEVGRLGLGYWSEDEFVIVAAQLVNISEDGILAIADGAVRPDRPAWVRLDMGASVGTARATVLAATWLRQGRCALRLVLDEDCPAGIYEALVSSLPRPGGARPPVTPATMFRPVLSTRWRVDGGRGHGISPAEIPALPADALHGHRTEPIPSAGLAG